MDLFIEEQKEVVLVIDKKYLFAPENGFKKKCIYKGRKDGSYLVEISGEIFRTTKSNIKELKDA